jgi:hypothetical protein
MVLSEAEAAVERICHHNAESDSQDDEEVKEWEQCCRRAALAR